MIGRRGMLEEMPQAGPRRRRKAYKSRGRGRWEPGGNNGEIGENRGIEG